MLRHRPPGPVKAPSSWPRSARFRKKRWTSNWPLMRGWNTSTGSTRAQRFCTRGARLLLSNYELHAEPDGAPRGYAQSYEKRPSIIQASGTLTAPFPGIHGWYWENAGDQEITVTLRTAGFYNISHEFRNGAPV